MNLEWKERRASVMRHYNLITKKILAINNLKEAKLKSLKGGYINLVLLATKGNTKRVIKISVDDTLQNEVYWYGAAKKVKVNVPKLIAYDLSKKRIGYKYSIMNYIDGEPKL